MKSRPDHEDQAHSLPHLGVGQRTNNGGSYLRYYDVVYRKMIAIKTGKGKGKLSV